MDALLSQYNSLLLLENDDPMKAHELNILGDEFLSQFQTTGDDEHLAQAITTYEQATNCLSMDDQRRGAFLCDLAIGYRARFERYGKLDDLQEAITRMEIAVASTGDDDANFPWRLTVLGATLSLRFECTGDMDNISEAIQYQKRAIQLTPGGHAGLPGWFNNLGNSYLRRFQRIGELDDLSEAIRNQQHAVELAPDEHADLPSWLNNLGISLLCRFQRIGDLGDISAAIENHKIATQITPDGHTLLPAQLNNLGFAYSSRFERTGDLEDISEAIRTQQRAIELTPDGHADLPGWLSNLGISFSHRFRCTGDPDDVSKAIQNQKSAIQLTPERHVNLPAYLNNLGTSFSCRFGYTGDLADLSEAIRNQQHAIRLTPDGHPDIPGWLSNLGNSFWGRFRGTGDVSDISEAIRNQERAVQLTPDGHSSLPASLDNLGISYSDRFRCTGDLVDISEAIRNQQRAIRLIPDGHADLPAQLSNLGNSFLFRYERTGNLDDVSEAIKNQERAVQLTPDGRAELPARLGNLGISLSCRFPHTGDLNDISEAIRIQRLAIRLTPDGHSDIPTRLNNLGISFFRRFERTRDLDDLSEAIRNQDSAVRLTPDGHSRLPARLNNLGTLFFHRFQCTDDLDDISQAIQFQQLAVNITPDGHADLPAWLNNLGDSFLHRFKATKAHEFFLLAISHYRRSATSPTGSSDGRLRAASNWAALAASHPSHSSSAASEQLAAHARIIQLLSLVSGLENTIRLRHQTLLNSSRLSIAASVTALSLGHPDKALEWLVQGRCIVWNQINQLRTPLDELQSHDPALAEQFSILSRQLEIDGLRTDSRHRREELSIDDKISLEDEAGMHIRRAKDWERLLSTIRNIPGYEDFLQPRKCANIMRRLPKEGNIIIINVHRDRCDALALKASADEPVHIPLPRFSYQEAERLATGLRSYLLSIGVRSRLGVPLDDNDSPVSHIDLPEVLNILWTDLVSPILEELAFFDVGADLKVLPRIWWCPTGPLAFLPIHAAGIYDKGNVVPKQTLSEFAVSSYIPTVHVLEAFNSVKNPNELLMVSVSQCLTPGMSSIPFARHETEKIAKQLERRQLSSSTITLDDEKATVNRVSELMDQFPCIHLACHASQNMTDPLESSIYLYDGPLKLSEIMKKNLKNSDFAFLSACQTSKGDENLSEEVVHLTSGMLAAGYRSVVGTMWSIYDVHGPDLAGFFYESLLENSTTDTGPKIDGRGAARALHDATRCLRESISDSPNSFLAWVPYIHMGI